MFSDTNFIIFGAQVTMSFVAFTLLARWFVSPRLAAMPRDRALVPLVAMHTLRHIGLTLLVTGVVGSGIPSGWALQVGLGDLIAQLLAIASVVALRAGSPLAIPLVWIFNLEGSIDLIAAYVEGFNLAAWGLPLGAFWYTPTLVVPALLVSHAMIFAQLRRKH